MAAIYRLPKDGDKVESWEGHQFVSAVAEGDDLKQALDSGWVDHPSKLAVTEKRARRGLDKARPDNVSL